LLDENCIPPAAQDREGMHMMNQIDVSRAQTIASKAGLKPARVKGTDVLQFTRRGGSSFEVIDWPTFQTTLTDRGLHVYESHGWLKIMK
jgi:hypothetical protein